MWLSSLLQSPIAFESCRGSVFALQSFLSVSIYLLRNKLCRKPAAELFRRIRNRPHVVATLRESKEQHVVARDIMLLKFLLRCLHLVADIVCGLYRILNAGSKHVRWLGGSRRDCTTGRSWSDLRRLAKLPQHIGWIILEEPISYVDISNIVVWCMALGITYISVYDHNGVIKKNKEIFHNHISTTKNKLFGSESKLYKIRLDSVHLNGVVNGYSNAKNVFVNIFSHTDGRQHIAKVAREICTEVAQGLLKPSSIDCSLLENYMSLSHNAPDPELLVLAGPTHSTLGFLPWHIRLSEILSLSSHYNISFEDFYDVLARYSKCEQRFGK